MQRPECPEVMTILWKDCITWATLFRTFAAAIHATVRHTCKAKSSGKLEFCNRHFIISGVLSPPPPNPPQNDCCSIVFTPGRTPTRHGPGHPVPSQLSDPRQLHRFDVCRVRSSAQTFSATWPTSLPQQRGVHGVKCTPLPHARPKGEQKVVQAVFALPPPLPPHTTALSACSQTHHSSDE